MIPGYPNLAVTIDGLWTYLHACESAGVKYDFGAKCPEDHLGKLPIVFSAIDCSGFVRSAVKFASGGKITIPDGSFQQGDWFAAQGFKKTDPANCALNAGHLRICVHHPDRLDGTGHIWFVINGKTLESYGEHGPGSREYNAMLSSGHRLDELATLCFALL